MYLLDFFWRNNFRGNSCSNGRFVIYTCFAMSIVLRSYGISAVLFRDFFVYLVLYGDTFLTLL